MNIKVIKEFKIGSSVFFSKYSDYVLHDEDYLALTDTFFPGLNSLRLNNKGKDVIFEAKDDISIMIQKTLDTKVGLKIGKFLVLDVIKYLGITIQDLKKLKPLIFTLDDKHKYEEIIYNSYIENNDFYLTEEQLNKAYDIYKKYRLCYNVTKNL